MPSTATTRNRLEKQAAGENSNTWGGRLNTNVIDLVDEAMDGVTSIVTAGGTTVLSANDYATDQSRKRVLNCTGTGGTITIPNVEKVYLVRNASSGVVIVQTATPTASAAVPPGSREWVFCDGAASVFAATRRPAGALVRKTANQLTANYTTETPVAWDAEVYDTDGFHDNATNNSRLTVMRDGFARLSGGIIVTGVTAGLGTACYIKKNGTDFDGMPSQNAIADASVGRINVSSPILPVATGDFFQLFFIVTTDTSVTVIAPSSWFAIEMVA